MTDSGEAGPLPRGEHRDSDSEVGALDRGLALVRLLRARCEWDRAQTPTSLIRYLLEETHEVVDAIQAEDDAALEGELGDLLLNLAFQVVLGEERGSLSAESVVARLEQKMRHRHPHLFGLGEPRDWEASKALERKQGEGVLDGLASGMDPLSAAHRIQARVSGVGFDWSDARGAFAKVTEELEEVREALDAGPAAGGALEEELGDLLFAVVNLVRLAGSHPTPTLDRANRKFRRRFERLEALARGRGIVLSEAGLEALDELWEELKRDEHSRP